MSDVHIADDRPSHKLDEVRAAVREHHFNLDLRHQAAGSALQIMDRLMTMLDMPYVQGDELRRRSQGEKKK